MVPLTTLLSGLNVISDHVNGWDLLSVIPVFEFWLQENPLHLPKPQFPYV